MVFLVIALWAISVVSLILGLSWHRSFAAIKTRLDTITYDPRESRASGFQISTQNVYHVLLAPLLARLGRFSSWTVPSMSNLDTQLFEAGQPMGMQTVELLGLKIFLGCVGLICGAILFRITPSLGLTFISALMLAFAAAGFVGPSIVLRRMGHERRREIRYSLPDMLDLLIINIEAGVGLDGAIHRAVERLQMPLTFELHRVLTEISAGKSRVSALREMAERLRIEQLSLIIASIQQSEQMGTSIGHALRQQADQLRRRRSNELREIAAKLPVKLLFPIVLFIFPTLFMVLLGPGLILMFRSSAF